MKARREFLVGACSSAIALAFAGVAGAAEPLSKWRAGTDYELLADPVPPTVPAGKVEVAEVFWYGCGHCYALDPALEEWNKNKAPYIEFVRVPVIWGPHHQQHAKLYYTVQALRRPELHAKVFNAIHREHLPLADRDPVVARTLHREFFARHGVSEQEFDAAYDSMSVSSNVQRAWTLTQKLRVDSVPIVFVNGKYSARVSTDGGDKRFISVIESLAASEKR